MGLDTEKRSPEGDSRKQDNETARIQSAVDDTSHRRTDEPTPSTSNSPPFTKGNDNPTARDEPPIHAERAPYSAFSNRTKWLIVVFAATAAVFNPLGSTVFFPAIPTIASAFHQSVQNIK